jgi:hypothetical protein
MKKSELQELLRIITKKVIKEYMSTPSGVSDITGDTRMSSSDINGSPSSTDTNDPLKMSPGKLAKMRMDQKKTKLNRLKQAKFERDSKVKEIDFRKKEMDRMKRIDLPAMTKDVQTLQGAKI